MIIVIHAEWNAEKLIVETITMRADLAAHQYNNVTI